MLETAKDLAKDPKWRTRIIEKPEIWGLESISGDALVIRLVMKTRANAKDDVARELRMRAEARDRRARPHAAPAQLDHAQRARGRPARARREPAEDQADRRYAGPRAARVAAQARRAEDAACRTHPERPETTK